MRRSFILVLALLQGCIVLPKTETMYDEQCQAPRPQMTLQVAAGGGGMGGCNGAPCLVILGVVGAVALGSLAVSGTIVAVHNTVQWIEKQATCRRTQR